MTCSGCLEQNPHSILTRLISLPHPALIPLITQQLIFHLMVPASAPYHHGTLRPLHRRRDPDDQRPGCLHRPLPESNTDIASGIAPVRRYLDMGLHVGLGTDVAGGFSLHVPCYGRCHPGFQAPLAPDGSDPGPGYSGRSLLHGYDRWWLLLRKKSAPSKKAMNLTP